MIARNDTELYAVLRFSTGMIDALPAEHLFDYPSALLERCVVTFSTRTVALQTASEHMIRVSGDNPVPLAVEGETA